MFSQKKGKADIYNEPEFLVRYVGKAETFVATKKGCTHSVVQKIWDNCEEEHLMRRVTVFISAAGIVMTDADNKKIEERISIKDISYCCAEKPPHERVFTWICKNKQAKKLECQAVVCATREKAQIMAVLLNKAFQIAYVDWKRKKEKQARMKQATKLEPLGRARDHGSIPTLSEDGDQASTSSGSGMSSPAISIMNGHNGTVEGEDEEHTAYTEAMMAQMNIVEEDEISFTDNTITVHASAAEPRKVETWT